MAGNKTKAGSKTGTAARAKAKPPKSKSKSAAKPKPEKKAPAPKGKSADKKAAKKPKVFLPGPKMNPVAKRALAKRGLLEKAAKKADKPAAAKGARKSRLPQMPPPRLVLPAKPAPKSKPSDEKPSRPAPPSKPSAKAAPPKPSAKAAPPKPGAKAPPARSSSAPPPPPGKGSKGGAPPGKHAIPPPPKAGKSAPPGRPSQGGKGADMLRIAPRSAPPSVGPRSTGPLKNAGKGLVLAPARSSAPEFAGAPGRGRPGASGVVPSGRGVTLVRRTSDRPTGNTAPLLPTPLRNSPVRVSFEERFASIERRLEKESDEFRQQYYEQFDMSWIYHDSALEGVMYTMDELRAGLSKVDPTAVVVESGLQPAADEIRRHKEAIEFVRDYATKKRLPPTVDTVKKIYLILHPSEGDLKTVKYRRDIPQHRLYFHEYAQPDKIAYKVRQIVDWVNDPEIRKSRGTLRIAARAHYDMLRVFPFQTDSGKVARLFMNMLLMRAGLPPSIIHSTERQRYYDALKGSALIVLSMVQESVENALLSVEKLLDEHGSKSRPTS